MKHCPSQVGNVRLYSKIPPITFPHFFPQVFGFLASFMFLLDFAIMLYEKRQESQLRKPENTTRAEALTEPLNA